MLASGGKNIVFYDTSTYESIYQYGSYSDPIKDLDWSSDSKYLLIVPRSHYTEIIRPLTTVAKVLQYIKVKDVSAAAFFKKSHRYIGVGCESGQVFVWDTKKQLMDKKMLSTSSNVNCINISSMDNYLSAGCENGSIILYGIKTNQKLHSLDIRQSNRPITSVQFSPKEQGMVGATNDEGYVSVWNILKRRSAIFVAKKHSAICSGIAFSPININFFVSIGYDRLICMCDLRASQAICTRETNYALTSVNMTPDGIMMACGHRNGGILIYDLRNNTQPLLEITSHNGMVSSVSYCRDIKTLSTIQKSKDNSIEDNISEDANEPQRNQSVSSDQLNNSFLRLYNSPINNLPTSVINDGRDSFLDDLYSPSSTPQGKLEYNETPQNDNDTLCLMSPITESGSSVKDLELVVQDQSHESTPEMEDDIPNQDFSIVQDGILDIDATEIATRSDLETVKQTFDESLKRHSMRLSKLFRTNMLQLHMVLCKQQLQLLDKMESNNSENDLYELEREMKRLHTRNAELSYEIECMRAEREKYLTSSNHEDI